MRIWLPSNGKMLVVPGGTQAPSWLHYMVYPLGNKPLISRGIGVFVGGIPLNLAKT
ncbi:hypothetical protein [Andreprevotia chitinilytica]|uniref:hypothetical protein n=1 Tax=Andreprevotia chitinilytica TaxID=396808 RepID=UPI001B807BB0|nr:hypothetical protein [Andreprevotia chitinilytica]